MSGFDEGAAVLAVQRELAGAGVPGTYSMARQIVNAVQVSQEDEAAELVERVQANIRLMRQSEAMLDRIRAYVQMCRNTGRHPHLVELQEILDAD